MEICPFVKNCEFDLLKAMIKSAKEHPDIKIVHYGQ